MENLYEQIRSLNFLNLEKETNLYVKESQRASNKMNPMSSTPRHSNKMPKIKGNLKQQKSN